MKMDKYQEKIYNSITKVTRELNDIFVSSHSQESLKEKLLLHLSSTPGFKVFFEENFNLKLKDISCHYQCGQNPTCWESLFTSECRHSKCLNPCLFKHKNSVRPTDLLSITKFKLTMIQTLISLLEQPDKFYFNYREKDFNFLKQSIFQITLGFYPKSKLILMNHVYNDTLFQLDKHHPQNNRNHEQGTKIMYCLDKNKVRTLDFIFVLSLCYLPIWIEKDIYSIMRLNGIMTNSETSSWRIEVRNEIEKLISPEDDFILSLKEKKLEILVGKLEQEILKLSILEQKEFVYFATLTEKIEKRNFILQSV